MQDASVRASFFHAARSQEGTIALEFRQRLSDWIVPGIVEVEAANRPA